MNRPKSKQGNLRVRQAQSAKMSNASLPVVLKNLPLDPPSISEHPPKTGIVEEEVSLTAGAATITASGISTKIQSNLWGVSGFNFQILKIVIWGSTLGSEKVTLLDRLTGVKSSDLGSAALRAKVGLHFPPSVIANRIYASNATDDLFDVTSGAVAQTLDSRITVKVWASS